MKKQCNLLGFVLSVVTGVALLSLLAVNAFFPHLILPKPNFNALLVLSLVALVLDCYLGKGRKHDFRLVPLYGAFIFGVFPLACFVATPMEALKLALMGAVLLTVVTFLFDSMIDRLSGGPASKAAPLISAFGLYLGAQCLLGIF